MIKLIKHTGECDNPDDTSLPFRLDAVLRASSLTDMAFVLMYGGIEEIVARASTADELIEWMHDRGLRDHPRLIRFELKKGTDTVVMSCHRRGRPVQ